MGARSCAQDVSRFRDVFDVFTDRLCGVWESGGQCRGACFEDEYEVWGGEGGAGRHERDEERGGKMDKVDRVDTEVESQKGAALALGRTGGLVSRCELA